MSDKKRRNTRKSRETPPLLPILLATTEHASRYTQAPWLQIRLGRRFEWHNLFVKTIEAAATLVERNVAPDPFSVYSVLGTTWFSHHESIELLLANGRYGDSMALTRMLLEDTDRITYFSYFPEEAETWRGSMRRAPFWTDPEYRQGFQKFRLPTLWKKIKEKGDSPVPEESYPLLSAAVHVSEWGAQYYGRRSIENPGSYNLQLGPSYDASTAFSAGLVLQSTWPRPVAAFLRICESQRAPRSVWRRIAAGYNELFSKWKAEMADDSWYRDTMTAAEKRVGKGEPVEDVMADVNQEIENRYGQSETPDRGYGDSGFAGRDKA